jgi:hypothetical protein
MAYVGVGFTEDEEAQVLTGQRTTQEQLAKVIAWQKAEESKRRWTLIIGGIGVLFAALKLGVLVVPSVRERSSRLGRL